ncbi:MAG: hypothetical protein JSW28_08525 [Thermoplasmata archaeon]|nr:MAG: hypothetical protein JSW28_08525 [Thermoplasmata archaeon]
MPQEIGGEDKRAFDWGLYPLAENFLRTQVNDFLWSLPYTRKLVRAIQTQTATRFIDWIDHMVLPEMSVRREKLEEIGYSEEKDIEAKEGDCVFLHKNSTFFPLIIRSGGITELSIKPEEVSNLKMKMDIKEEIAGTQFGSYRTLQMAKNEKCVLNAVERRGYDGFVVKEDGDALAYEKALRSMIGRNRGYFHDEDGFRELEEIIQEALKNLNPHRLADAFFRAERQYWLQKNRAGQTQKERQDNFGLGLGNHDHHAFRSSRKNINHLIEILEQLGLKPREAFYAGKQAGWGAQVMASNKSQVVVFADVDLYPEERDMDFGHKGLKPGDELGTIGMWVGLHGESVLSSGIHHLAVACDFRRMEKDLPRIGIFSMPPFSEFPFLRQAFTQGGFWNVSTERAGALHKSGLITEKELTRFLRGSAIGSHMEIIERSQGFAGFNQDSVSVIIKATDPRKGIARSA